MLNADLMYLCLAAFSAGLIDSIVGGGGLIQLPAVLSILPGYPVVSLLATNKLVSVSGTTLAAWRFSRTVKFTSTVAVPTMMTAFIFSFFGAWVVTQVRSDILKPVFLVMLFVVFIITIRNKDFGVINHSRENNFPLWKPLAIGSIIGFYDGFFGPGTGSFLIIAFVGLLGMTFVQGSAYAKLINLTTNIAALSLFAFKTTFLFKYAFPMMLFNMSGAFLGVRFALLKGNTFVRTLLRSVVFATILKMAYDYYR